MAYRYGTVWLLLWLFALSCNPPAPAPPEKRPPTTNRTFPAATPNLVATAQLGSGTYGSGTAPIMPFGQIPTGQNPVPNPGLLAGNPMSAISDLINTVQGGGDFVAIFGSVTNLVNSFAGGLAGGGALSGFGNLLSSLINGQQIAPNVAPIPTK